MKFRFIRDHLVPEFPVTVCCLVLQVSRSGYHRWVGAPAGRRAAAQASLDEEIRAVHAQTRGQIRSQSRCAYGSPRVQRALVRRGRKVPPEHGRQGHAPRGNPGQDLEEATGADDRQPPQPSHRSEPPGAELHRRRSEPSSQDWVWVCDITYVSTQEGFLFLAGILDVYSRGIVGWSMAEHMRAELVADALN